MLNVLDLLLTWAERFAGTPQFDALVVRAIQLVYRYLNNGTPVVPPPNPPPAG